LPGERQPSNDARALAGRRIYRQASADGLEPRTHRAQAKVAISRPALRIRGGETATVVLHTQADLVVGCPRQHHVHMPRVRVRLDVIQRLLRHAI
jgi:hypothetical protein